MIDSTVSEFREDISLALACLNEFAEDSPEVHFSAAQLDSIVSDGYNEEEIREKFIEDRWLSDLLPALNWWIDVASILSTFQEIRNERGETLPLLNEALSSYTAALAEGAIYGAGPGRSYPASMELLKRYRLYTRSVCALAQQICPGADLSWFVGQA